MTLPQREAPKGRLAEFSGVFILFKLSNFSAKYLRTLKETFTNLTCSRVV